MHITVILKDGRKINFPPCDPSVHISSDQLRVLMARVTRPDYRPMEPMIE